jgi:hypothetical protein
MLQGGERSDRDRRVDESRFSTIHDSVIASFVTVARCSSMRVPVGIAVSNPSAYPRCRAAYSGGSSNVVGFQLRSVSERPVASASLSVRCVLSQCVSRRVVASRKSAVAFACGRVPSSAVASAYDRVRLSSVASALRLSPKQALAPVLLSLRRAAQANRCARIAGRLSRLATGKPRQCLH